MFFVIYVLRRWYAFDWRAFLLDNKIGAVKDNRLLLRYFIALWQTNKFLDKKKTKGLK